MNSRSTTTRTTDGEISDEEQQQQQQQQQRHGRPLTSTKEASSSSQPSPVSCRPLQSIMIVKTLQDSLSPTSEKQKHLKLQRKRRLLKRRLDDCIKDIIVGDYVGCNNESRIQTGGSQDHLTSITAVENYNEEFSTSVSNATSTILYENFNVKFSNVSIRDYPMIPGDNPSIQSGPPLSIGWKYTSESTLDLDQYEESRVETRRRKYEFRVPLEIRTQTLLNLGYSKKEIRLASLAAAKIRRNRLWTHVFT